MKEQPEHKEWLNSEQQTLKTIANATSYGIFIEILVAKEKQAQELMCYGPLRDPFKVHKDRIEKPGNYFHPLLATLITGAARLMLAIAERLAVDAWIDWAFCDTDSMALAKPEAMPEEVFYQKAKQVQEWFTPLNPYAEKGPVFKVEDYNYDPITREPRALYCYAISSKRYTLFNFDKQGYPSLRKVSAHGLGHLMAPYQGKKASRLEGVEQWQQDLWLKIIEADLKGTPDMPDYASLQNFNAPAISRYAATTPALLGWFKYYNKRLEFKESIRPFNFLLAAQARDLPTDVFGETLEEDITGIHPIAPYQKNPTSGHFFDRKTGRPVDSNRLKTYHESLNRYHLHSESKFLGGDYTDSGPTSRRHIKATAIQHIGKEANQWEEQYFLGFNPDMQIEYGSSKEQSLRILQEAKKTFGLRRLARKAGLATRHLNDVIRGKVKAGEKTLAKVYGAIGVLSS